MEKIYSIRALNFYDSRSGRCLHIQFVAEEEKAKETYGFQFFWEKDSAL